MRVLGIEPAGKVAEIARGEGRRRRSTEFFGLDAARRLVAEHGHPRLVAANNVMAHVPDLRGLPAGLAELCDDRTVITVENPSLPHPAAGGAVRHDLPRALLLPLRARGRPGRRAARAASWSGSSSLDDPRRLQPLLADPRRAARRSTRASTRRSQEELAAGLLVAELWDDFARAQPRGHRRPARLARRAARVRPDGRGLRRRRQGQHADERRRRASRRPRRRGRRQRAPSRASSCRAARCRWSRRPTSPQYGADDVLILPWNIAARDHAGSSPTLVPETTCWVAVPEMRAQPVIGRRSPRSSRWAAGRRPAARRPPPDERGFLRKVLRERRGRARHGLDLVVDEVVTTANEVAGHRARDALPGGAARGDQDAVGHRRSAASTCWSTSGPTSRRTGSGSRSSSPPTTTWRCTCRRASPTATRRWWTTPA